MSNRVLFLVRDAAVLTRVMGTLAFLCRRDHHVHVGVQDDPPGAPSLEAFQYRYPNLTVGMLPNRAADSWRPLAAALRARLMSGATAAARLGSVTGAVASIEHEIPPSPAIVDFIRGFAPTLVITTTLGGADAPHVDYIRAARLEGARTLHLIVDISDLDSAAWRVEVPDVIALWNRHQRRRATEFFGVPVRRTCVIGAPLFTDVLDARRGVSREEYCARLGIDPAAPLVFHAVNPATDAPESVERWWQAAQARIESMRGATVLLWAPEPSRLRQWAAPLGSRVVVLDGNGADQFETAQRLDEALTQADVAVVQDAIIASEAIARERPTLALLSEAEGDSSTRRFCTEVRTASGWPRAADALPAHIEQLAEVMNGGPDAAALQRARAVLRVHGLELEPGFLRAARAIPELFRLEATPPRPAPPPAMYTHWLKSVAGFFAAPSVRPDGGAPGKLWMVAAMSTADCADVYRPLFMALAARGHRVGVLLTGRPPTLAAVEYLHRSLPAGTRFAGVLRHGGASGSVRRLDPDLLIVLPPIDRFALDRATPPLVALMKAAKERGVPIVASPVCADLDMIDGLATGGADAVLLWNEDQAVAWRARQHGGTTIVAGSLALDWSLDSEHRLSEAAFRRLMAIGAEPYVLFASAARQREDVRREREFVRTWVRSLRRGGGLLKRATVLIRPTPQTVDGWKGSDFTGQGSVVLCPTSYDPSGELDRVLLPESAIYAAAVVSCDDLSLVLAAAAGRAGFFPVTLRPAGAEMRVVQLGVADVVASTDDLNARLSRVVAGAPDLDRAARLQTRLRPRGANLSASMVAAGELEERYASLAAGRGRSRHGAAEPATRIRGTSVGGAVALRTHGPRENAATRSNV